MNLRRWAAVAVVLLVTLAPTSAWAASPAEDAGDAIARVRRTLSEKGKPSDGPMAAFPIWRDGESTGEAPPVLVATDLGAWLVWRGMPVGPLNDETLAPLLPLCGCEVAAAPPAVGVAWAPHSAPPI